MLNGPRNPNGPFHQSTFFWGCVGVFITIVVTVVAAMIKDLGWLLALAWPFAGLAIWEFSRIWSAPHVSKWLTGIGTIIAGCALLGLYVLLAPPPPAPPPAPTPPSKAAKPTLGDDFYVSFSFPHLVDTEVEIELKFLNHEENPISVENVGIIELFGNDKEPYLQLNECYDLNIVEVTKNELNSSPPSASRTQGASSTKPLEFVIYAHPLSMKLNGREASFPLEIPPKQPVILDMMFPVDASEKSKPTFNFFVVCPSIRFFDTRGQESVSVCPGIIDMTFSTEQYSADSYRVANLIATHEKHLGTMGPSPASSNRYRVFAQRAGRFQLTPKMESNSCPLFGSD